ncbi:hypothetical protein [Streptomyces sp. NBC_00557]|uniref:hypothetical protein n=1 Tax=Streptomyces sp. NBC_00557 TaxID=2975776 RepID=UPI002E811369|nr:hypothetical protein [Streptomyces sp. NBC_00557]WUC39547.1 hypothetical protein OG956_37845 [Streptomyces sp. NBC_00557]
MLGFSRPSKAIWKAFSGAFQRMVHLRRPLPVGARQTAALLSARFIYVSPSGAVPGCDATTPVHIVDGGYSDNNGAQSLVDLYTKALEPAVRAYNTAHPDTCVVPIYVHVANGYQGTTPTTLGPRPWEVLAPLTTAGAVHDQLAPVALQRARAAIKTPVGCPADGRFRFFVVQPSVHPGVQAPLGWTLSNAARRDLNYQLHTIACEDDPPYHKEGLQLTQWLGVPACRPDP